MSSNAYIYTRNGLDRRRYKRQPRCTCDDESWTVRPQKICADPKPDPAAPDFCMGCEHNVSCHAPNPTEASK